MLVMRLLKHDGTVFENFTGYDLRIVLLTERSIFKQYTYKNGSWGDNAAVVDVDDEGYVVLRLTPQITVRMEGGYYVQFEVSDIESAIQSPIVPVFEIIPSVITKIE